MHIVEITPKRVRRPHIPLKITWLNDDLESNQTSEHNSSKANKSETHSLSRKQWNVLCKKSKQLNSTSRVCHQHTETRTRWSCLAATETAKKQLCCCCMVPRLNLSEKSSRSRTVNTSKLVETNETFSHPKVHRSNDQPGLVHGKHSKSKKKCIPPQRETSEVSKPYLVSTSSTHITPTKKKRAEQNIKCKGTLDLKTKRSEKRPSTYHQPSSGTVPKTRRKKVSSPTNTRISVSDLAAENLKTETLQAAVKNTTRSDKGTLDLKTKRSEKPTSTHRQPSGATIPKTRRNIVSSPTNTRIVPDLVAKNVRTETLQAAVKNTTRSDKILHPKNVNLTGWPCAVFSGSDLQKMISEEGNKTENLSSRTNASDKDSSHFTGTSGKDSGCTNIILKSQYVERSVSSNLNRRKDVGRIKIIFPKGKMAERKMPAKSLSVKDAANLNATSRKDFGNSKISHPKRDRIKSKIPVRSKSEKTRVNYCTHCTMGTSRETDTRTERRTLAKTASEKIFPNVDKTTRKGRTKLILPQGKGPTSSISPKAELDFSKKSICAPIGNTVKKILVKSMSERMVPKLSAPFRKGVCSTTAILSKGNNVERTPWNRVAEKITPNFNSIAKEDIASENFGKDMKPESAVCTGCGSDEKDFNSIAKEDIASENFGKDMKPESAVCTGCGSDEKDINPKSTCTSVTDCTEISNLKSILSKSKTCDINLSRANEGGEDSINGSKSAKTLTADLSSNETFPRNINHEGSIFPAHRLKWESLPGLETLKEVGAKRLLYDVRSESRCLDAVKEPNKKTTWSVGQISQAPDAPAETPSPSNLSSKQNSEKGKEPSAVAEPEKLSSVKQKKSLLRRILCFLLRCLRRRKPKAVDVACSNTNLLLYDTQNIQNRLVEFNSPSPNVDIFSELLRALRARAAKRME